MQYILYIFCTDTQKNHKVYFEDTKTANNSGQRIKFDGVPVVINGRKVYECHHGTDRNRADKTQVF